MKNWNIILAGVMSMVLIAITLIPYVLWGEDTYLTVLDNIDHAPVMLSLCRRFGLFAIDVPTGVMDNMSSLYVSECVSILNVIYYIFSPFVAYITNLFLGVLVGFVGMYQLQKELFGSNRRDILLVTSAIYSILPTIPVWYIPTGFLPVVALVYVKMYKDNGGYVKWVVLSLCLPFFLSFTHSDLFICAFLLLATICISIKDKAFSFKWGLAFLAFCIGVVLVNYKLFYMRLVVADDLNRSHFVTEYPESFVRKLLDYILVGHLHVMHKAKIYVPVVLIMAVVTGWRFLRNTTRSVKMTMSKEVKTMFICVSIVLLFSVFATCDAFGCFNGFKEATHILKGFVFSRLFVFNRMLWYVAISALLIEMGKCRWFLVRIIVPVLLCINAWKVITTPDMYNDSIKSIKYNVTGNPPNDCLTWREFYDTELFKQIKTDIHYAGEPVVGVGYHAMILVYNDFCTIDGYIPCYPYAAKKKFERLIKPELDICASERRYFDVSGRRLYIFNSEMGVTPSRKHYDKSIKLNIDMKVFRDEYGGKYILSLAEISNIDELGIEKVGIYNSPHGVYRMFVYKAYKI